MRRALLGAICAVVLALGPTPARAAAADPLFFYTPQVTDPKPVPPLGYIDGACGLAVSISGQIYLSDYYHRTVDVFSPSTDVQHPNPEYSSQTLAASPGTPNLHTGPLDDPCGLSLDSSGTLYFNDYHRAVFRFPPPHSQATAEPIDTGDPDNPYANPTGVALDSQINHVFVDDRTYVAEYDQSGNFVRKIGEGAVVDGYGIAVSNYVGTFGYIYVPDAQTNTVKVFDPTFSTTTPKEVILGPLGGFGSLQESAVAVDYATGEVYVVDTLGPQLSERPQAVVYVFASNGDYEGRLKYATVSSRPVGLAVDNSGTITQSRVYVTSGLGENASLYGYPPHAVTNAAAPPLEVGSSVSGGGGSEVSSSSGSSSSSGGVRSSAVSAQSRRRSFAASPSQVTSSRLDGTRRSSAHRTVARHRRVRARKRHSLLRRRGKRRSRHPDRRVRPGRRARKPR